MAFLVACFLIYTLTSGVSAQIDPGCYGADLRPAHLLKYDRQLKVDSAFIYSDNSMNAPLSKGQLGLAQVFSYAAAEIHLTVFRPIVGAGYQRIVQMIPVTLTPGLQNINISIDVEKDDRIGFIWSGDGPVPLAYRYEPASYISTMIDPNVTPNVGDEIRLSTGNEERFALMVCDKSSEVTDTQGDTQTAAPTTQPVLDNLKEMSNCRGPNLQANRLAIYNNQTTVTSGLVYSDNSLDAVLRAGRVTTVQMLAVSAGVINVAVFRPIVGAGEQKLMQSVQVQIPGSGLFSADVDLEVLDDDRLGLLYSQSGLVPVAMAQRLGSYISYIRNPASIPKAGDELSLATGSIQRLAIRFCYGGTSGNGVTTATTRPTPRTISTTSSSSTTTITTSSTTTTTTTTSPTTTTTTTSTTAQATTTSTTTTITTTTTSPTTTTTTTTTTTQATTTSKTSSTTTATIETTTPQAITAITTTTIATTTTTTTTTTVTTTIKSTTSSTTTTTTTTAAAASTASTSMAQTTQAAQQMQPTTPFASGSCFGANLNSDSEQPTYNSVLEGPVVYTDNSMRAPLRNGTIRSAHFLADTAGSVYLAVFRPVTDASRQKLIHKQMITHSGGLVNVTLNFSVLENDRIGLIVNGSSAIRCRSEPGSYTAFNWESDPVTGDEVYFRTGYTKRAAISYCY